MSRQQFTSRNDKGQILTFQKSGSTASFDPAVAFSSGIRRVSWRLDNGTNTTQIANNSITYTGFTSDTGIRTIQMRGNSFRGLNNFILNNDNLYGNLDLTQLSELGGYFSVSINPKLTGITHSPSSQNFILYYADGCNLTGNLDLTPLSALSGQLIVNSNPNLTGITHSSSSQIFTIYNVSQCNLTGNLNLPLSGLGGNFRVNNNINLTGITHSPSSQNFSIYYANNCNLTGNLDLTPLSGIGGQFWVNNNSNLTGITHSPSSNLITSYLASFCNLTGNLDISMLSNLSGSFQVRNNSQLTSIINPSNSNQFTQYYAPNCNLTGNLNMSGISGQLAQLWVSDNPLLTGITHSPTCFIETYQANNCNLTGNITIPEIYGNGTIDLNNNSQLTGITHTLGGGGFQLTKYDVSSCNLTGELDFLFKVECAAEFYADNNPSLTGITFWGNQYCHILKADNCNLNGTINLPNYIGNPILGNVGALVLHNNPNLNDIATSTIANFRNILNNDDNACFSLHSCDFNYIPFTFFESANLATSVTFGNPRIALQNNNMIVSDVNHILVDFSGNATNNPSGWSNVVLNIGGSNAAPDSSSGGYDGLSAITFLTNPPYNWTITHS